MHADTAVYITQTPDAAPPGQEDAGVVYAVAEMGRFSPGTVPGWFTRREKLGRALWVLVENSIFRYSPKRADGFRAWLLARFGATVHGRPQVLRRTVRIEVPWNIELGEGVQIGDHARLYSLGPIRIGAHSIVSQYAHLCAGTHDFTDVSFPLRRVPITIGSRCWIATDVYVAPGVTIADAPRPGVMDKSHDGTSFQSETRRWRRYAIQ
jgi:putative colanic acid biosynthesis acetyltransferase WcaF